MDQNESSSAQNSSTEAASAMPPPSYSFLKRKLNEQTTTEAIFDMDLNKLEEEEELTDLNCMLITYIYIYILKEIIVEFN
jgi:hypothetical protein